MLENDNYMTYTNDTGYTYSVMTATPEEWIKQNDVNMTNDEFIKKIKEMNSNTTLTTASANIDEDVYTIGGWDYPDGHGGYTNGPTTSKTYTTTGGTSFSKIWTTTDKIRTIQMDPTPFDGYVSIAEKTPDKLKNSSIEIDENEITLKPGITITIPNDITINTIKISELSENSVIVLTVPVDNNGCPILDYDILESIYEGWMKAFPNHKVVINLGMKIAFIEDKNPGPKDTFHDEARW